MDKGKDKGGGGGLVEMIEWIRGKIRKGMGGLVR
jgi:hypothetical protein